MRYPRAVKPNHALDVVNVFAIDAGAPALAVVDRFVVSVAMGVKTYTLANAGLPGDGCARNITVKRTVAGNADTPGKITITGTAVDGSVLVEEIIPGADGVTVAGLHAFKSVTSVVGTGWTINQAADTVEVGFGTLVGLPASILAFPAPLAAAKQVFASFLDGALVVPVVTFDAADISKCTVDCSSGTYNGSKVLTVLIRR